MSRIMIGTCGWSYEDWVGSVYPIMTDKSLYLHHYAQQFPIVEIDSTFYAVPRLKTVENWARSTPDGFRFTAKVPREITHESVLLDCHDTMSRFVDTMSALGEKLSCVLLQFGYFNRGKFPSADLFMDRLEGFLEQYADQLPLACEIRNKGWLSTRYFELLRNYGVTAALVEHDWLPPLDELAKRYDVITGDFVYVRLMGDRKGMEEITTQWDQVVVDRSADLRRIAVSLRSFGPIPIHLFVNNHFSGHAPQTVSEIAELLEAAE